MVWQSLKYASYCSSLTKNDIKDIFQKYLDLQGKSDHSGIAYSFVVTSNYARIELWIIGKTQEENKQIFDNIFSKKEKIESSFGDQLDWQRRDGGKGSRIVYWLRDVNVFNEEDWPEMINFLTSNMVKFEGSIKGVLRDTMKNK